MKTLRLQLRFLVPLALTLTAAAYIALPLMDRLTLRWFARDELPGPEELAFENVPLVLRAWQEHSERAALDS